MKHFLLSLTAIVFFFSVISCDDSGSEPSSSPIVGTWSMKTYETNSAGYSSGEVDVSDQDMSITFKSDGSYEGYLFSITSAFDSQKGTYDLNGNTLILTETDGGETEYEAEINGNEMTITYNLVMTEVKITYTKK